MFTLTDALNAIKDKPEFSVMEKDGYTCIDYNIQTPTTFVGNSEYENIILLNLRGTCFDSSGKISRLPLHKFHNLNECSGYMEHEVDFSQKHYIMEKLDGSMIAPIRIGDYYRLGTRAGVTDVSMMAEEWLADQPKEIRERYEHFIGIMTANNFTPIFEFCSRMNKVVIDHPVAHLTLLAIRQNKTGQYAPKEQLEYLSLYHGIPLVTFYSPNLIDIKKVREWKDSEGIVIAFETGKRIKIKADDYVLKHRAKDLVRFEKDVIKLILEDKLDDVLPLVEEDVRTKLIEYSTYLVETIRADEHAMRLTVKILKHMYPEKKDFAREVLSSNDFKPLSSFYFREFDGKEIGLKEYFIKNCSSGTKIKEALNLLEYKGWEQ